MRCSLVTLLALAFLAEPKLQGAIPPSLTARLPESVPALLPVAAELLFQNVGSEPIVLEDFPRVRLLRVEIRSAENGTVLHQGFVAPTTGPLGESYLKPVRLAPGASYSLPVTLANRWNEDKSLAGPAFPEAGRYQIRFSGTLSWEAGGTKEVSEVRSPAVLLTIDAPPPALSSAFARLRAQPHLSWSLEPAAGLRAAGDSDLVAWEAEMRGHLREFPQSPWAPVLQYALALRLYDQSFRPGVVERSSLRTEAARLTATLLNGGAFPYRREVTDLQRKLDKTSAPAAPSDSVGQPATSADPQPVETEFQRLVQLLAANDPEALRALLHPDFQYNSRLNAAEWLKELAAEQQAISPAKLSITAKTVSIDSKSQETVLLAEVTYEAGPRKAQRRVRAVYRHQDGKWLLAEFKDRGVE